MLTYFALFSLTICAVTILTPPSFHDSDTQWHIAAGQIISDSLAIPFSDPWGFANPQQWYNLSWLFDIGLHLVAAACGDQGLLILSLLLNGFLVAECFRCLKAWNIPSQARFLTALLASSSLLSFSTLRPQLIACFLCLYTLAYLRRGEKNTGARFLAFLPIIACLWANTHGSLPLFFLFLGVFFLDSLRAHNWSYAKFLFISGLLCLPACLANPLGIDLFYGMARTLDSSISMYLTEWKPWRVSFNSLHGITSAGFIAALLAAAMLPSKGREVQWPEKILALASVLLALHSVRGFGLAAIICAPFLAIKISSLPNLPLLWWPRVLLPCLSTLLVLLFTNQPYILDTLAKHTVKYEQDQDSISYLKREFQGKNILNDYSIGGALTRFGGQKFKHFIDGRAGTAFTEERLQEYIDLNVSKTLTVKDILEKYDIQGAILTKSSFEFLILAPPLAQLGWELVHENSKNQIYKSPNVSPPFK